MSSMYIELVNRLLRRLNEVEIPEADFLSVRGIQSAAKDCILDAVREINTSRTDWPFNAVEHCQNLIKGVEEYPWPLDFTAADWNSFQIQKDDTMNVNHRVLKAINRDEWYNNLRDLDYDSESDGKNIPNYVFPSHGQGWGVSPSPNNTYPIRFRYYKNPTDPVQYNDTVTIPEKFDYVIIAGAMYHLNLFKENAEAANMSKGAYDQGVRNMVNMFLPNPNYVHSSIFNRGGDVIGRFSTAGIWKGQ